MSTGNRLNGDSGRKSDYMNGDLRELGDYSNGDLRYMLVGGMPQAIETYLEQNNLQAVDETKRDIVDLYEEDFTKIDASGLAGDIYDAIPANLSGNASRYVLSSAREGTRSGQVRDLLPDMLSSYTVNIAYHANNPGIGMD